MKKKRRIWIFAVAVAMTAVQGTVFAGGSGDWKSSGSRKRNNFGNNRI